MRQNTDERTSVLWQIVAGVAVGAVLGALGMSVALASSLNQIEARLSVLERTVSSITYIVVRPAGADGLQQARPPVPRGTWRN